MLKCFSVTCLSASRSYLCSRGNGVHTIQRLAEAPELSHVSGKYFDCTGKEIRSMTEAGEERAQQKLWETDAKLCASIDAPLTQPQESNGVQMLHLGSLDSARKQMVENNNVKKLHLQIA